MNARPECVICKKKRLRHAFLYCSVCETPVCPSCNDEYVRHRFERSPCCSNVNVMMLRPYPKQLFACPGCSFRTKDATSLGVHLNDLKCLESTVMQRRCAALKLELNALKDRTRLARNAVELTLQPLHHFVPPGNARIVAYDKFIFKASVSDGKLQLSYHGFKTSSRFSVRACVSYACESGYTDAKLLIVHFAPDRNYACADENVPFDVREVAINVAPFV